MPKAAVKLHALLDLPGSIATSIHIGDGKMREVGILDQLLPEPDPFDIMDRVVTDGAGHASARRLSFFA